MGHRGEDASRTPADQGGRPPWEDERYTGPGLPEYGQRDGYGPAGGYDRAGGGYDGQAGGYQGQDTGNDWYGGQPAAASGASFADTGAYPLSGRIADEYGTGPSAPGYPDQAQPQGRPFPAPMPPAASGPMPVPPRTGPQSFSRTGPQAAPRTGPQAAPRTGPQMVPHTGQQERYDGYDPRTGPVRGGDYDDHAARGGYDGTGGYGEPAAFGAPSGYGDPGGYRGHDQGAFDNAAAYSAAPAGGPRDGYGDYAPGDPDRDPGDRGHRGPRGKGGRGGKAAAGRTGFTAQPRRGRPGGRRPLLLAAVAVAVVIVIGVAAYLFLFKPTSPASAPAAAGPLPTSGTAPSSQACVKKYGTYCHIELNTDDPSPLTVSELFPPAFTNDADKNSFSLVSTKLDKTCSKAVIGPDLSKALKTGDCTQVVRASYVSGSGKIMGTIGVVNLASTNEAHYAGKVVGQSDFVAPLTAAKGVAKKLGQGTGVVEAEFKGHYLILTWSEFTNGTTPSTKAQESALEQFSSDLVAGTANISLSQRMVTGSAPTPAAS